MGVTIRHFTHLFKNIDAGTRLLITLSDGKPDDYDGYRGEYGIEDTRQAFVEAKRRAYTRSVSLSTAKPRLPATHVRAVNYTLVDDVPQTAGQGVRDLPAPDHLTAYSPKGPFLGYFLCPHEKS
ncbi:MAG: hypothetical protein Ct9H300mP14_09020 [Gammaproteobacteria bacterium]|nr:MAG: hypothetical protein Ct9H300mP14_09020 [Gammaproteobacteria bacterium]